MIISASRRTDIPSYYSEWLVNRLKEKYVLVRNPMNIHQVSKIDLSPDVVDAIVFWTKNPTPMLPYLVFRHFNSYPKKLEKKRLYGDMIQYSLMYSTQWSTIVNILKY